ncbi:hypothetical protein KR093_004996 [Drosophila rubida]|uniref:UBC core domain-containing protein n=1 Tax=Drosophila rubida TaxID=30044 RepID=A0AAD4PP83_9MUSC|nr:hypothetical protein KR093_004996 [Drosophila rubida]
MEEDTPAVLSLKREHNYWLKEDPHGFQACPTCNVNGSLNWKVWRCAVPGLKETPWEGGIYQLLLVFNEQYPNCPPKCVFDPTLFHPNVYPWGTLGVSPQSEGKPISIEQFLLDIQQLLSSPDINVPSQRVAHELFANDRVEYDKRVRLQASERALK